MKFASLFILTIVISFLNQSSLAQLSPGDIAFTGYNADGDDQFSFIATTTINSGEIIYFTDRGWEDTTPGWNTVEGIIKYTVPPGGLSVGDMIVVMYSSGWTILPNLGSITNETGSLELSESGDQLFAFQTTDLVNYTPTFIAGIHMNKRTGSNTTDANWDNLGISGNSNESDLPDGLTNGTNAIRIYQTYERDNAKYNNSFIQGNKSDVASAVNTLSKWFMDNTNPYTLGYPTLTSTIADGYWNSIETWDSANGIPGKTSDVTISHGVTIDTDCASDSTVVTETGELTLDVGANFTVFDTLSILSNASSSGSFIANGNFIGMLNYKRYMSGNQWHLVASPADGQNIQNLVTNSTNQIPLKDNNYGIMDYNTGDDDWNDFLNTTSITSAGNFIPGAGYSMRRDADGVITYSGALINENFNVSTDTSGNGWNLLGNSFSAAISADSLILNNLGVIDTGFQALYVWKEAEGYDGSQNCYEAINLAGGGGKFVQAGQGFFVKAAVSSTYDFETSWLGHQGATEFKSATIPWPTIKLIVDDGTSHNHTTLMFNEDMTTQMDAGYDAGMLKIKGQPAVFSKIEGDAIDFTLQCLPYPSVENLIVPIGIDLPRLSEVTFTSENIGLPAGTKIILEDRKLQEFKSIGEKDSFYKVNLDESTEDRFYLHIGNKNITAIEVPKYEVRIIPQPQSLQITLVGLPQEKVQIRIFDTLGRLVSAQTISPTSTHTIDFHRKTGIYILNIQSGKTVIRKKFSWNSSQ